MKKQLILATVGGTLLFATNAQAADLLIDNFDNTPQSIELNTETTGSDLVTGLAPDAIGGSRNLSLTVDNIGFPGNGASLAVAPPPPDDPFALTWNNDSLVSSMATVTWDANGSGLDADLTGQSGIRLDLFAVDLSAEIAFTIEDSSGNTAELDLTGLTPGIVSFDFDNFTNIGGVDLTDIQVIEMMLDGPPSVDVTLDLLDFPEITTNEPTPEPSTILGLVAVGGAGLLSRRRQKK